MLDVTNMKKLTPPEKKQHTKEPHAYVNKWGTIRLNKEAMEPFNVTNSFEFGCHVYIKSFDDGIRIAVSNELGEEAIVGKSSHKTGQGSIYVGKDNMAGIYALPKQRPETIVHENGIEIIYKR